MPTYPPPTTLEDGNGDNEHSANLPVQCLERLQAARDREYLEAQGFAPGMDVQFIAVPTVVSGGQMDWEDANRSAVAVDTSWYPAWVDQLAEPRASKPWQLWLQSLSYRLLRRPARTRALTTDSGCEVGDVGYAALAAQLLDHLKQPCTVTGAITVNGMVQVVRVRYGDGFTVNVTTDALQPLPSVR